MKKILIKAVAAFGVLALAVMAYAGDENAAGKSKPWEKGALTLGVFYSGTNSNVRIGLPGVGVDVDVEEALGLETSTSVFRVDGMWRFTDNLHHRIDVSWFSLRRNGAKTLGRDIIIDGTLIPLGAQVSTRFDLDIYRIAYSYSFFQDDRMDLAVGAGVFVMPIGFEFTASGSVNEHTSESVTAPLPVLGLRADFAITPKWMLKNSLDVFYLELGDFKGSIVDLKAAVEYNWLKNFGVGLGVENFNANVEAQGGDYPNIDFKGAFGFRYLGVMMYGKLYF